MVSGTHFLLSWLPHGRGSKTHGSAEYFFSGIIHRGNDEGDFVFHYYRLGTARRDDEFKTYSHTLRPRYTKSVQSNFSVEKTHSTIHYFFETVVDKQSSFYSTKI